MTIEEKIARLEYFAKLCEQNGMHEWKEDQEQLAAWLRELQERRKAPEIITCGECAYYDPPHVEKEGARIEYKDLPEEAYGGIFTNLVSVEYGINVGGRCCRDYNAGYADDKRVYVPENNFCGRAERRTDGENLPE